MCDGVSSTDVLCVMVSPSTDVLCVMVSPSTDVLCVMVSPSTDVLCVMVSPSTDVLCDGVSLYRCAVCDGVSCTDVLCVMVSSSMDQYTLNSTTCGISPLTPLPSAEGPPLLPGSATAQQLCSQSQEAVQRRDAR